MSLADLSYRLYGLQAIQSRGVLAPDLDQRCTAVIAELEALIHDVRHEMAFPPLGLKDAAPPATGSDATEGFDQARVEAAFEAWLTSDDKPDMWPIGGPDATPILVTEMLRALVHSHRPLPAVEAAELGMPPGARLGYAATELLLAVIDPAGVRCRSYRSALYYLRDRDDGSFPPPQALMPSALRR